jgi:hypothetical protein
VSADVGAGTPESPFLFRAEQFIGRPVDEVFAFFARAENLQRLTPDWLHFKILNIDPNPVREGTLIRYRLRWRVFPIYWTTRITTWDPPHRFVDEQLKGPYQLWRHEHRFVPEGSGTRIHDEVQYLLPFGALGRIVHRIRVRNDVESIFAYRRSAITSVFGVRENGSEKL